jgi:peptide/nickel transport system permease protein
MNKNAPVLQVKDIGPEPILDPKAASDVYRTRRMAVRRLLRNKMAILGATIVSISVFCAVAAPVLAPYEPVSMDLAATFSPPTREHVLGTDSFGRDVLSRVIYGTRVSLVIALASIGWAAAVGIPIGLIAGYSGGQLGNVLMRLMDAFLSFPPLLLAIAISGTLGGGQATVVFALGMIWVPGFARLVRGSTLSVRAEPFVTAALGYGASSARILWRHIIPNLVGIIIVEATLGFSHVIISEATLSFLGIGVPPPAPSWGRDLNDGRAYMRDAWWLVIVPALTIIINVLAINFLGDGLRDALDPRTGE